MLQNSRRHGIFSDYQERRTLTHSTKSTGDRRENYFPNQTYLQRSSTSASFLVM